MKCFYDKHKQIIILMNNIHNFYYYKKSQIVYKYFKIYASDKNIIDFTIEEKT